MAFLQGSDKHKSSSGEASESRNTPEPSETTSYFLNAGTKGGNKSPFTPYSETLIQQTTHDDYPRDDPSRVPSEAPSVTERNVTTDTEWSKRCQAAVNSEEGHVQGGAVAEEQPLSTLQQARPDMLRKVYIGEGDSELLEIPDLLGDVIAGQVEEGLHDHISSEDPTCQKIKVSNTSMVSEYHAQ